jgi:hypothetical protein
MRARWSQQRRRGSLPLLPRPRALSNSLNERKDDARGRALLPSSRAQRRRCSSLKARDGATIKRLTDPDASVRSRSTMQTAAAKAAAALAGAARHKVRCGAPALQGETTIDSVRAVAVHFCAAQPSGAKPGYSAAVARRQRRIRRLRAQKLVSRRRRRTWAERASERADATYNEPPTLFRVAEGRATLCHRARTLLARGYFCKNFMYN